jgi:hypothetical protein
MVAVRQNHNSKDDEEKKCVPYAHRSDVDYRGYSAEKNNNKKKRRKGNVCSSFRIQLLRYAHRQVYHECAIKSGLEHNENHLC